MLAATGTLTGTELERNTRADPPTTKTGEKCPIWPHSRYTHFVTCEWCLGSVPRAARADSVYCSSKCRVYAFRSRRRYDTKAKQAKRRPAPSDRRRHHALQLRQLEEVVSAGGGTEWTTKRIADLRVMLNA